MNSTQRFLNKIPQVVFPLTLGLSCFAILQSCHSDPSSVVSLAPTESQPLSLDNPTVAGLVQLQVTSPDAPADFTYNDIKFVSIPTTQSDTQLYVASLEDSLAAIKNLEAIEIPGVESSQITVSHLEQTAATTQLIYENNPNLVTFDDVVLMFATSQLPEGLRTPENIVATANTLFPTRPLPYSALDLNPVPSADNTNFVSVGQPLAPDLIDVAAVYVTLFLPAALRTPEAIATSINTVLPSANVQPEDIIAIPGVALPIEPVEIESRDFQIGDPNTVYFDNEIWSEGNKMVWISLTEGEEGNLYISDLDPNTGQLIPPDGRGLLASEECVCIGNGPEWGVSAQGGAIYYNAFGIDGTFPQIFRTYAEGDTTPTQLTFGASTKGTGLPRIAPFAPQTNLIFFRATSPTVGDVVTRLENDLFGQATPFPNSGLGSSGPRWVPNEQQILTTVLDENNTVQTALFDVESQTTTQLTTDEGDKLDAFIVEAPEFNGEQLLATLINVQEIGIYREIGGAWTRINTITIPIDRPGNDGPTFLFGINFFTFKGRSYVSTIATKNNVCNRDCTIVVPLTNDSELWVSSFDSQIQGEVSGDFTIGRVDPEVYNTGSKLFISYYIGGANAELRMVEVELPDFR